MTANITATQREYLTNATRIFKTAPFADRKLTLADLDLPEWASELSPFHPDVIKAHKGTENATNVGGKMLLVVPFREHAFNTLRERSVQILLLVEKLDKHLRAVRKVPGRDYAMLVIEMHDQDVAFNKGYLLNLGVRVAESWGYDYVVAHDADLYPLSLNNTYDLGVDGLPVHMCSAPKTVD